MLAFGVSSRGIRAMLAGFGALGLDVDQICRQARLDPAVLADPDRYLLPPTAFRLWRAARGLDGQPDLGVRTGAAVPFGGFDVIDYLLASASDVEHACRRMSRYFALGTTMLRWEAHEADNGALEMRLRSVLAAPLLPPVLRDFGVSAFASRLHMLTGGAVPLRVGLVGRGLAPAARYADAFRCATELGRRRNYVRFAAADRTRPILRRDDALGNLLERHADRLLADVPRAELDEAVRREITVQLEDGEPNLASVARGLGASTRTLQRRLAESGTTLSELVDDIRRALAIAHLAERRLSIAEIGFLLGYAEPSTFHRAFKRWTGVTPSAYRRTYS